MKVQAIVVAAGSGERLKAGVAKPFVMLRGRPLIIHTLAVLQDCALIQSIIVAAHPDCLKKMTDVIHQAELHKVSVVVAGGATRSQSVKNTLAALDADTDVVLIHDGARPLITADFVEQMIMAASFSDHAVIAAVPVKSTIKRANRDSRLVEETLDRRVLWDVQTPQIFEKRMLLKAYSQDNIEATDDAALVERMGGAVKIFLGLEQNIKITTPYDLQIAEKIFEG